MVRQTDSEGSDPPEKGLATIQSAPHAPIIRTERTYLLVIDGQVSYPFELPPHGEVVIGRASDATIRLDDQAASRQHARVDVAGGEAWVVDLGSRNGTRVNGETVTEPRVLLSGDVVTLCSATLIFHREIGPTTGRTVLSMSHLRQRLIEETDRSLAFFRPVSLLCLQFLGPAPSRPAVLDALGPSLRVSDLVAGSGGGRLLLLLPERDTSDASREAERLLRALSCLGKEIRAGVVSCPRDGSDPDALLLACQSAAQDSTKPGAQAAIEDTAVTLDLGDVKILLIEPAMKKLYALIERLGKAQLPVLIEGETGVGKELAAKALHHHSARKGQPLLSLNCSAFTENLVESELFGHERGAFSGAVVAKPGLIETAHKGTLFLDEIGEMPLPVQAKLLRVLETQKVMRVGDVRERQVDVRIVAATNRDLQTEISAGRFRRDLYFRLSSARLTLPPLRDRPRELPVLARNLLAGACRKLDRGCITISDAAMHHLLGHKWPGNVRELRNLMDFVAATIDGDTLFPWQFEGVLRGAEPDAPFATKPQLDSIAVSYREAGPAYFRPIDEEIRELERRRMMEALAACGGVQIRTAALISMPARTFTTKMKQYNLSSKDSS